MSQKYPKLDFLGIGAEKSGTTWIADCLTEHPEVCFSREKELFFFNEYDPHYLKVKNTRFERLGYEWYKKQFDHCDTKSLIGEFTPTYLYCREAAKRIKETYPDIKLISILRDPVSRAFSQYIHDKKIGLIKNISFEEALEQDDNYIEKGNYAKYLGYYYDFFDPKQILILFFDDLKKSPDDTLMKLYEFLELKDKNFKSCQVRNKSNSASKPLFTALNYFMIHTEYFLRNKKFYSILKLAETTGLRRIAILLRDLNTRPLEKYPDMLPETREYLKKQFLPDIMALEKLCRKDLNAWKN